MQEAAHDHRCRTPGEQAGDVHGDEHDDGQQQHAQPSDPLRQPAEDNRADQLPEIAEGQDHSDFSGRELPFPHQHRHRERNGENRIGIEEGRRADDQPGHRQLAGDRQPFEARADIGRAQLPLPRHRRIKHAIPLHSLALSVCPAALRRRSPHRCVAVHDAMAS